MKGMTIQYVKKTISSYDEFNNPIYTEELVDVADCLVGQPTTDESTSTIAL